MTERSLKHSTIGRPRSGDADVKVSIRISNEQAEYIAENWPTRTAAIRAGLDNLMHLCPPPAPSRSFVLADGRLGLSDRRSWREPDAPLSADTKRRGGT